MATVNSQVKLIRAFDLLKQGKLALAEAGFLEILQLAPRHFDALYLLATLNAQRRNLLEALAYLDRAMVMEKRNAAVNNLRGRILLDLNRPAEALLCFDRAIANKGDFAEAFDNRGKALQELNRPVEALESFGRAIQLKANFADAYNNRGIVLHALGRSNEALADFNAAIQIDAGFAQAHSNRGNLLKYLGDLEAALASYDTAIALEPGSAQAHSNRGTVLCDLHREAEAMEAFERAIAIDSKHAEAHYNRGNLLSELARWDEALASYDRAIELIPGFADAYINRSPVYCKLERFDEALSSVEKAIALRPDSSRAHNNRGIVMVELERREEALPCFDAAIALDAAYADAWCNRGAVLCKLGHLPEALESSDKAVALQADSPGTLHSRAMILKELGRLEDALRCMDKAIELQPIVKPMRLDLADAHSNRGLLLHDFNRVEEALQCYERALAIRPDSPGLHTNRGAALLELGRYEEALKSFERAVTLKPDLAKAQFNEAICRLLRGDYELAWKKYEYRWLQRDWPERPREIREGSLWDGKPFDGTLLVWEEQGLGDQILYASLLPELAGVCGKLVVRTEARLVSLYERSFPGITVISNLEPLSRVRYDFQLPMGSVCQYFRKSPADFHAQPRGFLKADQARSKHLRENLAADGKLVCGLSWFSRRKFYGENKSIALGDLAPVLGLPDIEFVDLQYGDTSADRQSLLRTSGYCLRHVDEIDTFYDIDGLAALIEACDVVVTVSNTTAHLAGALAKQTLLMLPNSRGVFWYWGVQGATPWYPSIRSFRQTSPGNWGDVVKGVQIALKSVFESDSREQGR